MDSTVPTPLLLAVVSPLESLHRALRYVGQSYQVICTYEEKRCLYSALERVPAAVTQLQQELDALRDKVQRLRTYSVGTYTRSLGVKVLDGCVEVAGWHDRMLMRKRAAAEHLGEQPYDAVVCHRCDNFKCVNGAHFFWGTQSDNMRDAVLKGRRGKRDVADRLAEAEAELKQILNCIS